MLANKLREFGIKGTTDERKNKGETKEMDEHVEGERKRSFPQGKPFAEIMKDGRWKNSNSIWVGAGESLPWRVLDIVSFYFIYVL